MTESRATPSTASRSGYKWMPSGRQYLPCSPYPSVSRFGDGTLATVYVAATDRGAMAEFFRLHPELLALQDELAIRLFELDLDVAGPVLDLMSDATRHAVEISVDELRSADRDCAVRWRECQRIGAYAVEHRFTAIRYPSASATWADAENMVLFGQQAANWWECLEHREVPQPGVEPDEVNGLA